MILIRVNIVSYIHNHTLHYIIALHYITLRYIHYIHKNITYIHNATHTYRMQQTDHIYFMWNTRSQGNHEWTFSGTVKDGPFFFFWGSEVLEQLTSWTVWRTHVPSPGMKRLMLNSSHRRRRNLTSISKRTTVLPVHFIFNWMCCKYCMCTVCYCMFIQIK